MTAARTGTNQSPGAGDVTFNRGQPYHFVGNDFQQWRAYKVEVPGNFCNTCHRMALNDMSASGTAIHFGPVATGPSEVEKNPVPGVAHADAPRGNHVQSGVPYVGQRRLRVRQQQPVGRDDAVHLVVPDHEVHGPAEDAGRGIADWLPAQ